MKFDLAIVGGGPAGTAAAIEARRQGLSVAVLERGRFPRDKVCGEFISGESAALLDRLIPKEAARGIAIHKSAFISPHGRIRTFPLPEPALGLSRRALDQALWRAANSAGAICRESMSAQRVRRLDASDGNGALWEVQSPDGSQLFSRHLVLACGRWWAIEGLSSPARTGMANATAWVGFKAHFSGVAISDAIEMFYFPDGYCGLAPVEDGAANVCCLVHRELLKRTNGNARDFRSWLASVAKSPALDSRLRGAEQITQTLAAAPVYLARRAGTANRAFLIGDASGFIDPFTGDGISIALQSGTLAARLIAQSRKNPRARSAAGDVETDYCRRMKSAVARSHSVAGLLRGLVRAPAPAQELAAFALPIAGPALTRATRFRAVRWAPPPRDYPST